MASGVRLGNNSASKFVVGLKSRNEDVRIDTAYELQRYATTELREASLEELSNFLEEFNHHIYEMVSSHDVNEKKGGIYAIMSLVDVDVGQTGQRISRFANYLQSLLNSTDIDVLELAAKAVGRLYLASGTYITGFIEGLVERSFEWLQEERVEARRHAAVLVLRELALSVPTYFFQQIPQFLDAIFEAVRDPKPSIREGGVAAIRVALSITAQRETKESQQPIWYKRCLEKAYELLDDGNSKDKSLTRDDRIHGSLLVVNELIRCSNSDWERMYKDLRHLTHCQTSVPQKKDRGGSVVVRRLRGHLGSTTSHLQDLLSFSPSQNMVLENLLLDYICESRCCRQLTLQDYSTICSKVLSHKNSRNPHIQTTLLQIFPRLAALDKEKFNESFLSSTVDHLRTMIRTREKEKAACFISLGLVSVAVGLSINPYLSVIMRECRANLPSKELSSKKKPVEPSVCICISLIARGVGPSIQNEVRTLLDSMMASGLSAPLSISLQTLASDIPELKRNIAEKLLRMLSQILQRTTSSIQSQKVPNLPPSSPDHQGVFNTVLALRTLGTFNFDGTGQSLMPFVNHICDNYLTSEHKEIRLEAIPTCLHLIKPVFASLQQRRHPTQPSQQPHIIFTIISKILWVSVSDSDSDVRLCVLVSFDETFDSHLSQAENIRALMFATGDERFELREHAIHLLGRLSTINPSYILPELRKILMKILNELDYSGIGRNRELSAKLLGHLISSAPRFMRNFVDIIMAVLVPKLKDQDPNPAVTMCILSAIGDLAQIGYGQNASGTEMRIWLNDLLPLLLEMLSDGTSGWKRQVALVTLGQLVENMGYAVHPYAQYPSLLDILLSFLKTEQQPAVRRETLRVLGFLGALDPYKHKMNTGMIKIQQDTGVALICMTESKTDDTSEMTTSEMLVNLNYSSLEEFYPACAIAVLMRVIKDPTLVQHQNEVVRAVTFIFQSLGVGGEKYLSRVIPPLLNVIRSSDSTIRDYLFKQLSTIIDIVKHHIRNYLDEIVCVLKEFWQTGGKLENTSTIIAVVESIAMAVGSDFKIYLKDLVPLILKTFINDIKECQVTIKLLQALQKFSVTIEEYLHMILPHIVRLFDAQEASLETKKTAIVTVDLFSGYLDLSEYISEIIHPLLRTIDSTPELRPPAMELLCSIATQLGRSYENFVPVVLIVLNKHKITNHRYDILVGKVVKGLTITDDEMAIVRGPRISRSSFSEPSRTIKKGSMSKDTLVKAWSFNRLISKDDWLEWLRKLSIELMRSSPSPAIKACYSVAQNYVQLSRDLFNAAFVSCWSELDEPSQDDFLKSLKEALTSQDIPEITQTLLNLAEFMEHCDRGHLPLDLQLLGEKAIECRAYAKALHYKEEQFHKESQPSTAVLESLIAINNKLGQTEASAGLLEFCNSKNMTIQERWFEKLHDWDKALEAYECKLKGNPENTDLVLGQMRCLEALGEWGDLYSLTCQQWTTIEKLNENCKRQMSRISCASAWVMGKWETMEKYIDFIPRETQEGSYYRAVLAIHNGQYDHAHELINLSRDILDTELTAMVGESYQRSYNSMVAVQMLAELEEVVQFKRVPDRRKAIAQLWWERLQGCQRDVEDWQKILQVRSLVLAPQDDMRAWLKFASMCRKMGRKRLAHKTLITLIGYDPATRDPKLSYPYVSPQVTYQYCKYLYNCTDRQRESFSFLQNFLKEVLLESSRNGGSNSPLLKLVSRVYLKLGLWHQELNGLSEKNLSKTLHYLSQAKETDKLCYKAWHAYACTNFEALLLYRNKNVANSRGDFWELHSDHDTDSNSSPSNAPDGDIHSMNAAKAGLITEFAVAACNGFASSIALSGNSNTLQDTLRLLTVCFDYGSHPPVNKVLQERLKTIQIDNWLQVIPQLIARIDTPHPMVNRLIHQLLVNIGKQHPQALLYPLTVAAKSSELSRTKAADIILKSMREHSNELVNQAMMISEELIRTAILWHEKWYEGLEEASRLYYSENDIVGMFRVLKPLHAMLERGQITTMKEMSFNQAYGRDLQTASEWCKQYQTTNNSRDLSQAWDLYYQVFRRISKQLPLLTNLDLKAVSPRLYACKDLSIAVPGSYFPNAPLNRISCIKTNIQVLTSKQKPRKLCIRGSIGHDFVFILKGHEDLRQDERVMQLFGLVNTLLVSNPETFRRNLTIQRYAVIPLSTNSGLIGWVPNCDTLHVLIRDWREKKKILLTIEHKIMIRMATDFDHLTLMQKVEVFEHALSSTQGDDLARLLWFKSPSSEVWFDRRTNYTRSLAVMSMVGYVLGLGDRHPSNLMLHQFSGKIVHIDFGDCFEVAMARDKFPEKIPFRLTRMLINAMEVTGIEGTYRMTCESVMALLREHKDSLMAMLEAFVYDPLLNWRLIEKDRKNKKSIEEQDNDAGDEDEVVNRLTSDAAAQNSASDAQGGAAAAAYDYGKISALDRRASEAANKKAVAIVNRVKDKLTGKDFTHEDSLDVKRQVELLIAQATSHENLCQCYIGWCPFW